MIQTYVLAVYIGYMSIALFCDKCEIISYEHTLHMKKKYMVTTLKIKYAGFNQECSEQNTKTHEQTRLTFSGQLL